MQQENGFILPGVIRRVVIVHIDVTLLEFIVDGTPIPFGFPVTSIREGKTDYWVNRAKLASRILRSRGIAFPSEDYVYRFDCGFFVYAADIDNLRQGNYFATLRESEVPPVLKELSIQTRRYNDGSVRAFNDILIAFPSSDFASQVMINQVPDTASGLGAVGVSMYILPTSTIKINSNER